MGRLQVVRFEVGQRHFALDVMAVKEVVQPRQSQPVPGQPAFVQGLVDMRGEYVPLIDLRERFGVREPGRGAKIIVLTCLQREIALLVDSVGEVQWIEEEQMRNAALDTSVGGTQAVESLADVDGTMVLILRGESLLSESEWAQVLPL